MAFEEFDTEIALLLQTLEGDLGDRHEIAERVHRLVDEMSAYGLEPPEELRSLIAKLEAAENGAGRSADRPGRND